MKVHIAPGFAEAHRAEVAALFWAAFHDKLRPSLGDDDRAIAFITQGLRPEYAFSAVGEDGRLLGAAGIKTAAGGFLTGSFTELGRIYGLWGAMWRGAVLDQFERPIREGVLQMDGIFVAEDARSQGVGSALLDAVVWTARMNRCAQVRLDVVDGNDRARALYERYGFEAVGQVNTGMLAPLLGFRTATTMVLSVSDA